MKKPNKVISGNVLSTKVRAAIADLSSEANPQSANEAVLPRCASPNSSPVPKKPDNERCDPEVATADQPKTPVQSSKRKPR